MEMQLHSHCDTPPPRKKTTAPRRFVAHHLRSVYPYNMTPFALQSISATWGSNRNANERGRKGATLIPCNSVLLCLLWRKGAESAPCHTSCHEVDTSRSGSTRSAARPWRAVVQPISSLGRPVCLTPPPILRKPTTTVRPPPQRPPPAPAASCVVTLCGTPVTRGFRHRPFSVVVVGVPTTAWALRPLPHPRPPPAKCHVRVACHSATEGLWSCGVCLGAPALAFAAAPHS